jgi:hypothetical protein
VHRRLAAAALLPLALAACPGEGTRSAACGLAQVVGPNIVLQQLDNPRMVLTDAPRGLPLELPIRVVGQRERRAAVTDAAGQIALRYEGAGFPADPTVGFALLVLDDTSERVMGVLVYDAVPPRERPQLGYVTGGERSVPLFGVRVSWADVSNARCPLLGDTAQAAQP